MSELFNHINSYLWAGYIPPSNFPNWISSCVSNESVKKDYSSREAANVFDSVFDKLIAQASNGRHVVPLSGGWDSRAILGALLERVEKNRITTVTFGVPGQLDFDLAKKVADFAGVKHFAVDLREIEISWDIVRMSARNSPWTFILDSFFNFNTRVNFSGEDDNIWIGFLGDPLTGSHLITKSLQPQELLDNFSKKQRRVKTVSLCSSDYSFAKSIVYKDVSNSIIGYDDALDFGIRQANCIAPVVLPLKKWESWSAMIGKEENGAQVIAPFVDPEWANYWILAPRKLRKKQKLYLDMLTLKFPQLFSLPGKSDLRIHLDFRFFYMLKMISSEALRLTKYKFPRLGIKTSAMQNYLDFDEMFRTRDDYRNTLIAAFDYLKENNTVPWLNLDTLWNEHMNGRKHHGSAFLVLIGLAANLIENPL